MIKDMVKEQAKIVENENGTVNQLDSSDMHIVNEDSWKLVRILSI